MPGDYVFIDYNPEWPEFVLAVESLELRLRRARRPVAADLLLRAYGRHRDELHELARRMAIFATEELRRQERHTRVRPDTAGHGGPRLEDALVAEVIDRNIMPGSVGIAKKSVLDASVPWWPTNEEGSSARVGGILYGTFYGDHSAGPPDPGQFREHPLFAPGNAGGGLAGLGTIHEPIPARRFIKKAVEKINAEWHVGFTASKLRFDTELVRVLATVE